MTQAASFTIFTQHTYFSFFQAALEYVMHFRHDIFQMHKTTNGQFDELQKHSIIIALME